MKDSTIIALWVSTLLALLEISALVMQVDGAFFMPVVAAISLLAGHEIRRVVIHDGKPKP